MMHEHRKNVIKKKHAQHAPCIKYSNTVSFANEYKLLKKNHDIIWKKYTKVDLFPNHTYIIPLPFE